MNEPSDTTRDDVMAELVIKLLAFGGGALMGALIGGLIISHFVQAFVGAMPHLWLYCALGFGLLGGLSSYRKAAKQLRRQQRSSEAARQLGLSSSTDNEEELEEALGEIFAGSDHVSLSNVVHKDIGSAHVAIADLQRIRHSSRSSSSASHSSTRTIAYFESPELDWPSFTLQPEGVAVNLLSKLVGVNDIDFADFPTFSSSYHLTGTHPDQVRPLFTPALLQYFTDRLGLEVRADENRLVLVRPGEPCEPHELESFLEQATDVFTQLIKASVETKAVRADAEARGPSSAAEQNQLTGILGAAVRRMLVTPEQLDAFLIAPTPRRIPSNIKRRRMSSGSLVGAVVGAMFFLVGSFFAVYSMCYAEGPWNDDRVVPLVFGIVFPLIGLPMCIFTLRYRYINGRLLRHGVVVDAIVLGVEKTDVRINDQQQYRMEVRFNTQMGHQQTHCNIYGREGRKARELVNTDRPTRMLYDPRNPRRSMWADSLLLESVI